MSLRKMLRRRLLSCPAPARRPAGRRSHQCRSRRPTVECLEARLLLAVTSVLDTSTGSLLVRGTDGDDAISVTREGTQIVVRAADMVINSHPADQVQALTIRAGAGNDRVIVGEGLGIASITVDGEEGDDFLQGSAANEALRGGAGDDTILPGGGTDSIDGGAGFDTVLVRGTDEGRDLGVVGAIWVSEDGERGGVVPNPEAGWAGAELARNHRGALERGWTPARIFEYWRQTADEVWGLQIEPGERAQSLRDLAVRVLAS